MIKLSFTIACLLIVSSLAWADTPAPTEASIAIIKLKELAKGDADELTAAMQTFDTNYTAYRLQKESGTLDVSYAKKELISFANRYTRLIKTNPQEAKLLLDFINGEIKFLNEEFKPKEKFKEVYLNMSPPVKPGGGMVYSGMPIEAVKDSEAKSEYIKALRQNRLNAIYNERQSELWSFFRYIEIAKKDIPAFEPITDAGCDLAEARKAANAAH